MAEQGPSCLLARLSESSSGDAVLERYRVAFFLFTFMGARSRNDKAQQASSRHTTNRTTVRRQTATFPALTPRLASSV